MTDFVPANPDRDLIAVETGHVVRWIGPIRSTLSEGPAPRVHIDIHWIEADSQRPFHTLVTTGMAQAAMNVPPGGTGCTHAEVMIFLPEEFDMTYFETSWPVHLLHQAARVAHDTNSWIWEGHTLQMPKGSDTPFTGAMLMRPWLLDPGIAILPLADGNQVEYFALACLYADELDFKLKNRSESLLKKVEERDGVFEFLVAKPGRPSFV